MEWCLKRLLIGASLCLLCFVFIVTKFLKVPNIYFETIDVDKKNVKTILVYTPYFGSVPWWSIPSDYNFTHNDGQPCEVRACQMTYNKSYFNHSDAVLFHSRDMNALSADRMKELQKQDVRKIWIWFMQESPYHTFMNLIPWDNFFNWTATYRLSSDIYTPYYFNILKYRAIDNPPKPGTNFAKGKTRQCLFINSNCDKFRMGLIRNLKKYIGVDVLGKCRDVANPELKLDCPRKSESCWKLQQEYKFYLAFENSFCDDYVTEKYYMNGLKNNLIPVVLSGGDFNNSKVALPHSYINLLDFKDMKSLADYLLYLDKNDTAYNEYHQWRYNYRINASLSFMCDICKSLWQQDNKPKFSTVKLSEFWSENSCKSYNDEMFQKYLK